jgi:hypothetical protein
MSKPIATLPTDAGAKAVARARGALACAGLACG